jgi:short-subunit dehydrogenase
VTTLGWDGAVALVTGASRGIGRAVAEMAAARGARVGLVARNETELRLVLDKIGGRGVVAVADVASRTQTERAVAEVEAALGAIDIVVANAGVGLYGAFVDAKPDDFERLLAVNVLGTMYVLRSIVPSMAERRRGHVVVIGSIAGRIGAPFEAVYSATKFAQEGLVEALAIELSAFDIGVSIVNPGVVDSDFFEARGHVYDRTFPRLIRSEKIARAVVRSVERGRHEAFVPGWMRAATVVRHLAPPLYRSGTRRSFKGEVETLERSR